MQREKIIVIPPTHEQSTPSFHVEASLVEPFIHFLGEHGLTAWEPPEALDKEGPGPGGIVEIEIEADTPVARLERLKDEFLVSMAVMH